MKILFFGSDELGIPCLDEIKKRFNLIGVVTASDKPKGRGLKISSTPVKEWALKNGISVYQPAKIDNDFVNSLKNIEPELIVLISYGEILPINVINIPSAGAINLHPSLLPKYRGAAPLEWTLINGEKETGISIIKMNKKVDTGEIILQKKIPIDENDDAFTLRKKIMEASPEILVSAISHLKDGEKLSHQTGKPSYAPKLKKENGLINWHKSCIIIYNLVRGVIEWPGAYTFLDTLKGVKYLKIWKVKFGEREGQYGKPGEVIKLGQDFIEVACGQGNIKIMKLQIEGKKILPAEEFIKGVKIPVGTIFKNSI